MNKIKQPSIFHLAIARKLREEADKQHSNIIRSKDIIAIIYFARVNSEMHNMFLKEMETLGFIKKINQKKHKIMYEEGR